MNKKTDNQILMEMVKHMDQANSLYKPSDFWIKLNKVHFKQLSNAGYENFKRTINMKYFNWGILGIIRHQLPVIFGELQKKNFSPIFESRLSFPTHTSNKQLKHFNPMAAFLYKLYVASYYDHVFSNNTKKNLSNLEEPSEGNPLTIFYKNKSISQDLCNSAHEFLTITSTHNPPKYTIGEIGAGYGRLAYIFLQTIPKCSYCIIDIPPALFIAQKYLSTLFPKEKIFSFRPFTSYKEVRISFEESRIKFLMPHQMEYLPAKSFNLMINISSLHEMSRLQITNHLQQVDRLCRGYFYTKQWRRSRTKDNLNIKENEYPIPKNWNLILKNSPHPIQKMFFDALYKIT